MLQANVSCTGRILQYIISTHSSRQPRRMRLISSDVHNHVFRRASLAASQRQWPLLPVLAWQNGEPRSVLQPTTSSKRYHEADWLERGGYNHTERAEAVV
jgi:hypothetical protein